MFVISLQLLRVIFHGFGFSDYILFFNGSLFLMKNLKLNLIYLKNYNTVIFFFYPPRFVYILANLAQQDLYM